MAVGFTPKFIIELPFGNHPRNQVLVLLLEAANVCEWEVNYLSEGGLIANTRFSMSRSMHELRITMKDDHAILESSSTGSELFDLGRNKKKLNRLLEEYNSRAKTRPEAELQEAYLQIEPHFVPKEQDVLLLPPPTAKDKLTDFLSIFMPIEGYFVTPIIIVLNILVFIVMIASGVGIMDPDGESLVAWGSNFKPLTLGGEWWRLLSNCFLHFGLFHLLLNMYALSYIGLLLEPYLGRTRFLAAYLITGVAASICSLWWHDLANSAGASGAIFGMYGVFLAMLTTNLIERNARKSLLTSIGIFVVFNLVYGAQGNIDNAAHIGGLLSGMVIGYAFVPGLMDPAKGFLKHGIVGILTVLCIVCSFIFLKNTNNDIQVFDDKMKKFSVNEEMALETYKMAQSGANKEDILYQLGDRGIYYWEENKKLLTSADSLRLPDELHSRVSMLQNYCDLRIKSYQFIYKAIRDSTDRYRDSIKFYDEKIGKLLDTVK